MSRDLIDLINFQKSPDKPVLDEFLNDEFLNYHQTQFSEKKLEHKSKYILFFKTRDVILKCYPGLLMASKKGMSLKKIMKSYSMNQLPVFEKS